MQFSILALAVMAVFAFADVTSVANAATSALSTQHHAHHIDHEHVVDFRKPCDCPPAECHPLLNAKSVSRKRWER